ncbi:hypothetical protein [Hwangdonia lutea]|uniref:Uncharacterized protein n=1 Tax=Hwangdonia lutea TaxID=3075823 RepID=A0AA97ENM3_9FLAO|nr:hypothetical protein [Hwangdonia sp. SCSIO 19198]WOD43760.1 hypothetical protein RNZ46_00495 [Hwangdonia sp. SCSIO 19198]
MEEFFRQNYLLLTHSFEILAAITGLVLYKKYKFVAAKYFIWFLVFVVLAEFISTYTLYIDNDGYFSFLKGTVFQKNYWWGTIYWSIGSIMFFSFYFIRVLEAKSHRLILRLTSCSFLLFSVLYIIFNWEAYFTRSLTALRIFGALIIFLCAVFYFIEVLMSDKILNFYKSINFYIATTIFVWWLITTPLIFYDIYFRSVDWNFIILKWQIYLFVNIFMYSTFTFALIYCKPELKND